jgi:predicted Fe-S protein YdhL (DUF1289 family)
MINSVILFKYRCLTNRMITYLAMADSHEARGNYRSAEECTKWAWNADEERDALTSQLTNIEIGILMREEERRETKVNQR